MSVFRHKSAATVEVPATGVSRSLVVSDFLPEAERLRACFEERFGAPRSTAPDRFVWDYWHMPDQYTYLRTYGDRYFPAELTDAFMSRLRRWGREVLGCPEVSPPWFSYYLEGCVQQLHADVPHGPWAYVFSLTRWQGRGFTGGETELLRPESLDFWRNFDPDRDLEATDLVDRIPSEFNQLTVFDARIPHGVRMVRGTHDPLDSRLVLHGWFKQPELEVSEGLRDERTLVALKLAVASVEQRLRAIGSLTGVATARTEFGSDGRSEEVTVLSNTLVSTAGDGDATERAAELIRASLRGIEVPGGAGWAILPIQAR